MDDEQNPIFFFVQEDQLLIADELQTVGNFIAGHGTTGISLKGVTSECDLAAFQAVKHSTFLLNGLMATMRSMYVI